MTVCLKDLSFPTSSSSSLLKQRQPSCGRRTLVVVSWIVFAATTTAIYSSKTGSTAPVVVAAHSTSSSSPTRNHGGSSSSSGRSHSKKSSLPSGVFQWKQATFIAPASPTAVRSTPHIITSTYIPTLQHQQHIQRQDDSCPISVMAQSSTALGTKKKGSSGSASSSSTSSTKVQVKLLKHVAGTGQAGEVIKVTPAFFNNKLRPTKSAVMITDEQLAQERQEAEAKLKAEMETATLLKQVLEHKEEEEEEEEESSKTTAPTLLLSRKAGPDGQLFGGIGPKTLMEELVRKFPTHADFLSNNKGVKILDMLDESGAKMKGDIKHTGKFRAILQLCKGITATLDIVVVKAEH